MCDEQEYEDELDRQAIAALLMARGEAHAAGIVAVSVYQSSFTGGFVDDGGFRATLWVPPELYDRANDDFREPIGAACAAVVIGEPFLGLNLRVRRPPYDSEWAAKVINSLEPSRARR